MEQIGGDGQWTDTQDYLLGLDDAMANDNLDLCFIQRKQINFKYLDIGQHCEQT